MRKDKETSTEVDYFLVADAWCADSRYENRHLLAGQSRGLPRIDKGTLAANLLYPMAGDAGEKRVTKVSGRILKELRATGAWPDRTHYAAGQIHKPSYRRAAFGGRRPQKRGVGMNFFAQDRYGGSVVQPTEKAMRELLESLSAVEDEHPDVSLQSESGWCISAFASGLVVLENVETGEGPWHMSGVSAEAVLPLWKALASDGAVDIHSGAWVSGYGPKS